MTDQRFLDSIATPAKTIEGVIDQLTFIIDWSKAQNSRIGYFAALYRKVTIQVKQGIIDGFFDDGPRMERLDIIFANRYIQACHASLTGQTPTQSWEHAFSVTSRWRPIALQHLLMGMNAHINLDLGIAAAETVLPEQLPSLKSDFGRINDVLARLVDQVQNELAEIWPPLAILSRFLGSVDNAIVNFSMGKARDAAWAFAEELAPLTAEARSASIAHQDASVAEFSEVILHPGVRLSMVLVMIRLGERGTIREHIGILE
jgi:hypothetical protein